LLRQRVAEAGAQVQETTRASAAEWKQSGERRAVQVRHRARQIAADNPLYIIAGAAGTAFVLGFLLQIRRSNHARRG
jgi:ElaB/YqjD/DUF883 family membrane-anchored ribosome-binding protein